MTEDLPKMENGAVVQEFPYELVGDEDKDIRQMGQKIADDIARNLEDVSQALQKVDLADIGLKDITDALSDQVETSEGKRASAGVLLGAVVGGPAGAGVGGAAGYAWGASEDSDADRMLIATEISENETPDDPNVNSSDKIDSSAIQRVLDKAVEKGESREDPGLFRNLDMGNILNCMSNLDYTEAENGHDGYYLRHKNSTVIALVCEGPQEESS